MVSTNRFPGETFDHLPVMTQNALASRGPRPVPVKPRAGLHALAALIVAFLLPVPSPAQAPSEPPPVDDAPPAPGAPAPTPDPSYYGAWKITRSVSPTDKTPVIKAVLEADAPVTSTSHAVIPVLILRYRAGSIDAYTVFDLYLGEGNCPVTVQVSGAPASSQIWLLSDDGRAAFVPGDCLPFMKSLMTAQSLTLGVTPYHQAPIKATFTPKGADRVVDLLVKAAAKIPSGPGE